MVSRSGLQDAAPLTGMRPACRRRDVPVATFFPMGFPWDGVAWCGGAVSHDCLVYVTFFALDCEIVVMQFEACDPMEECHGITQWLRHGCSLK